MREFSSPSSAKRVRERERSYGGGASASRASPAADSPRSGARKKVESPGPALGEAAERSRDPKRGGDQPLSSVERSPPLPDFPTALGGERASPSRSPRRASPPMRSPTSERYRQAWHLGRDGRNDLAPRDEDIGSYSNRNNGGPRADTNDARADRREEHSSYSNRNNGIRRSSGPDHNDLGREDGKSKDAVSPDGRFSFVVKKSDSPFARDRPQVSPDQDERFRARLQRLRLEGDGIDPRGLEAVLEESVGGSLPDGGAEHAGKRRALEREQETERQLNEVASQEARVGIALMRRGGRG